MDYTFGQATQLAVLGLAIVFGVLAILWFTLVIMGVVSKNVAKKKTEDKQKTTKNNAAPAPAAAAPAKASADTDDEDEIAAVIAAISAMMGTPAVKLSVTSGEWKPNFSNKNYGGINNAKFYSKNKWKDI